LLSIKNRNFGIESNQQVIKNYETGRLFLTASLVSSEKAGQTLKQVYRMQKLITGFLIMALMMSCQSQPQSKSGGRYDYPDILDMKGTITLPQQGGVSSFSDLGTWHSFSLSEEQNPVGGFVGPYLMRQQQSFWLSPSIIKLQIKDQESGTFIDLSQAKEVSNTFYPGLLKQTFEVNQLEVSLCLFNVNERSSIISAEIINNGSQRQLQLGWTGSVFSLVNDSMEKSENGLIVKINEQERAQLLLGGNQIELKDSTYSYQEATIELKAGERQAISAAFSYTFTAEELQKYTIANTGILQDVKTAFAKNEKRWNGYLQKLLQGSDKALLDVQQYDKLAVKSLLTLMHNWRSAAGDIFHQGIVPSYSATYFQGLWAWDSWKHAVAIAPFEAELAKDQIRAMYDYQNGEGMIADCFFRDLSIEGVNWRNTKAPLSGWCIYEVYRETQDLDFLKEMYPKLLKYHQWWYANRDHDQNGLCEYGSTDGTRIAAAWESGMDNAVRFDQAKIIENHKGAYSLDQESVDLNAYLAKEKYYINQIADILGEVETAEKYLIEADRLKKQIQEVMYCASDGYFYDVELDSQNKIRIQGPEGWSPLYNQLATAEQAKEAIKVMMDSTRFNTPMPFPTLSAAHEKFNPQRGYWRGPVWLDQAYFAIVGINNYGFEAEAKQMAKKMVESAKGLAYTQEPIRENYHPLTKEGLNAKHFSWSAAHILMLF
jgi:putative isomerase